MSRITLNIVEPGVSAPNTGLSTHGIATPEAIAIASVVLVLAIAGIIITAYVRKKHQKEGKTSKLVYITERIKTARRNKKRIATSVAAISFLVLGCVFTAFLLKASAMEGDLTVNVSDDEFTIELANEPVFAVFPVEVSIEEAAAAGYTLTAYVDNTDLVSTTNPGNIISMVAEDDALATLADNTWGLVLGDEPSSKDQAVYATLSTDQDNPTILKSIDDYSATEANDTTTIYYGFYITPDVPYGTYEGGDINYEAKEYAATVVFDGNGAYFDDDNSQTQNTIKYLPNVTTEYTSKYSHTPNINDDGVSSGGVKFRTQTNEVITIPNANYLKIEYTYGGGYTTNYGGYQGGYGSLWEGSYPDNTPNDDYATGIQSCGTSVSVDGKYYTNDGTSTTAECTILGDTVTFGYWTQYGGPGSLAASYGYYAKVTGYDADDNEIHITANRAVSGEYVVPDTSPYTFLGWAANPDAIIPTYTSVQDIAMKLTLDYGDKATLYAIKQRATIIAYDGNGNDGGEMADQMIMAGTGTSLIDNSYTKDNYIFNGWNTAPDGSGDTYSNLSYYYATPDEFKNITLYAQWELQCDVESICYRDNGANSPTTMGYQSAASYSDVYLWASNYSYAGHGFAGWSKDRAAAAKLLDDNDDNDPIIYGPNEKIRTEDLSSNGMNLYAVWLESAGDLQGFSCPSDTVFPIGNVTALRDTRDDNVYAVAKLTDGNCWMVENLRLDNKATLTVANTNNPVSTDGIVSLINTDETISNHLSPTADTWMWAVDTPEQQNQAQLNTNNTKNTVAEMTGPNANIYSYGNYYNWYSATGGWGNYDKISGNTDGDICPNGWRLPENGQDAIIQKTFPSNNIAAGIWNSYHADRRGGTFRYWSSTPNGRREARYVSNDSNTTTRNQGHVVRCLTPVNE